MTQPEELERERASDVPEGAEVRADGSYVTPVDSLTDDQKAELLPDPEADAKAAAEAEEAARLLADAAEADREQAELDSPPRELGSPNAFSGAQ